LSLLGHELDCFHEILADVVAEFGVALDLIGGGAAAVNQFLLAAELLQNGCPVASWSFEILKPSEIEAANAYVENHTTENER